MSNMDFNWGLTDVDGFDWFVFPDENELPNAGFLEATRYVLTHFSGTQRSISDRVIAGFWRRFDLPEPHSISVRGAPPIRVPLEEDGQFVDLHREHIMAFYAVMRVVDEHEGLGPDDPGPYGRVTGEGDVS
jgi:hypothetical protein